MLKGPLGFSSIRQISSGEVMHSVNRPSDEANARPIYGRSCSERMEEAHFTALERHSGLRVRHTSAQVYAQGEGALGFQRD